MSEDQSVPPPPPVAEPWHYTRARQVYRVIAAFGWDIRWKHPGPVPDDAWPIDIIAKALLEASIADWLRKETAKERAAETEAALRRSAFADRGLAAYCPNCPRQWSGYRRGECCLDDDEFEGNAA